MLSSSSDGLSPSWKLMSRNFSFPVNGGPVHTFAASALMMACQFFRLLLSLVWYETGGPGTTNSSSGMVGPQARRFPSVAPTRRFYRPGGASAKVYYGHAAVSKCYQPLGAVLSACSARIVC